MTTRMPGADVYWIGMLSTSTIFIVFSTAPFDAATSIALSFSLSTTSSGLESPNISI